MIYKLSCRVCISVHSKKKEAAKEPNIFIRMNRFGIFEYSGALDGWHCYANAKLNRTKPNRTECCWICSVCSFELKIEQEAHLIHFSIFDVDKFQQRYNIQFISCQCEFRIFFDRIFSSNLTKWSLDFSVTVLTVDNSRCMMLRLIW